MSKGYTVYDAAASKKNLEDDLAYTEGLIYEQQQRHAQKAAFKRQEDAILKRQQDIAEEEKRQEQERLEQERLKQEQLRLEREKWMEWRSLGTGSKGGKRTQRRRRQKQKAAPRKRSSRRYKLKSSKSRRQRV